MMQSPGKYIGEVTFLNLDFKLFVATRPIPFIKWKQSMLKYKCTVHIGYPTQNLETPNVISYTGKIVIADPATDPFIPNVSMLLILYYLSKRL